MPRRNVFKHCRPLLLSLCIGLSAACSETDVSTLPDTGRPTIDGSHGSAAKFNPEAHSTDVPSSNEAPGRVEVRPPYRSPEVRQATVPTIPNTLAAARQLIAIDPDDLRERIAQRYSFADRDDVEGHIAHLLNRYESGDDTVAIDLALMLAHLGTSQKEIDQAKTILARAAESGVAEAHTEFARLLLLGDAATFDPYEAFQHLEQASAANDPEGIFLLAVAHRNNLLPGADLDTGFELLETAAELGHFSAAQTIFESLYQIAWHEASSPEVANSTLRTLLIDYPQMENWLTSAANRGRPNDFRVLINFYKAEQRRAEVFRQSLSAAKQGSFHGLETMLNMDSRRFFDPSNREQIESILRVYIESGETTSAATARFYLASLALACPPSAGTTARAYALLEEALEQRSYRAGIALYRLRQGATTAEALSEAHGLFERDVYDRYLQLRHEVDYSSPLNAPPLLKNASYPDYPPELLTENLSGQVVLELIIDEEGKIKERRIVSSTHPAFESYALEAVSDAHFLPAKKEGRDTAAKVRLPINFTPTQ